MVKYLASRIFQSIILILGTTLIIFLLLQVLPGDPVKTMMGDHVDPNTAARISKEMHLDDPMSTRYFRLVVGMLSGDLGLSYKTNRPVIEMILAGFPNTL